MNGLTRNRFYFSFSFYHRVTIKKFEDFIEIFSKIVMKTFADERKNKNKQKTDLNTREIPCS